LFKRRKLVVNDVEPIEKINIPDDTRHPRRVSEDPLLLIGSGNPQRGLI